jgi:hypothetical protein
MRSEYNMHTVSEQIQPFDMIYRYCIHGQHITQKGIKYLCNNILSIADISQIIKDIFYL